MELIPRKKLILSIIKKLKTVDNILPLFKKLWRLKLSKQECLNRKKNLTGRTISFCSILSKICPLTRSIYSPSVVVPFTVSNAIKRFRYKSH